MFALPSAWQAELISTYPIHIFVLFERFVVR
jgi:hypothetical protein